ncbi:MAG: cysteine desulfurase NifS [Planctomycetota bacterium]
MSGTIYLDNNATTPVAPEVFEAMKPFLSGEYGNPSSLYKLAGRSKAALDTAREEVAALIGAEPDEILFTSCGTESDNAGLLSALSRAKPDERLVTTRVEHAAVLNLATRIKEEGRPVTLLGVDSQGALDVDELRKALEGAGALSVMWANNETGVLFPIEEIAEIAKERGVPFHTDAVQAVGKIPINVKETPADYLALSGHKLHAPKGVGALFVRRGAPFRTFLVGGHQEGGRRGGTENVASIVGLGVAARLAREGLEDERTRVKAMRDRLEEGLLSTCPGARVNGDPQRRLPNTSGISFDFIEGESILLLLDREDICASSGSACTTGSLEPSHVLQAMGVPYTSAHGTVRLSLSRHNTDAEIDRVLEVMPGIIRRLRELSPFGRAKAGGACCEGGKCCG